jgi:glutaredoxin
MNVTIYSQPTCPACDQLKKEYKEKGIPFTEIVIGKDISVAEFKEIYPSVRRVPFVVPE